jgi:hypothetical protein
MMREDEIGDDGSNIEEIRMRCGFLLPHARNVRVTDDIVRVIVASARASCDRPTTVTVKFFIRTSLRRLTETPRAVDLFTDSESPPSPAC